MSRSKQEPIKINGRTMETPCAWNWSKLTRRGRNSLMSKNPERRSSRHGSPRQFDSPIAGYCNECKLGRGSDFNNLYVCSSEIGRLLYFSKWCAQSPPSFWDPSQPTKETPPSFVSSISVFRISSLLVLNSSTSQFTHTYLPLRKSASELTSHKQKWPGKSTSILLVSSSIVT